MEAILRIMYHNRIVDYDLSSRRETIQEAGFKASCEGGNWRYSCGTAWGELKMGDAIVIDHNRRIAALVLEKPVGEPKGVKWADGLTIGRREDNDIILRDPLVSGHHCRTLRRSDGWYLCDCGSTNGTYVNDERIENVRLKNGDVIKLGRYRLKAGNLLILENADGRVMARVPMETVDAGEAAETKPYPWFSRSARMHSELEPLSLRIESAPSIGDKPRMGIGGISLNPTMMAVSLGNQALRYGLGRKKYSKLEQRRAEVYAEYLTGIEGQLQEHAKKQREIEELLHPSVKECMKRTENVAANLWERQPDDSDFLTLRLGLGTVPVAAQVEIPSQRLQLYEDELEKVPGQLKEKYAVVENVPIACSLMQNGNCGMVGARVLTTAMAQSMVAQLAALHCYDEVKIVVLCSGEEAYQWEWMRWLPHCVSEDNSARYFCCAEQAKPVMEQLERMVQSRLERQNQWSFGQNSGSIPHYVFVVADPSLLNQSVIGQALMMNRPELGVSGIFLGQTMADFPHSVHQVLELRGSKAAMQISLRTDSGEVRVNTGECDISLGEYDQFARAMAPIRLPGKALSGSLPESVSFLEGYGINSLKDVDMGDYWNSSCNYRSMAVPIGVRANGEPFFFDIHEKMHGPHGLVAGMTGSGKSEMVQSWILSMAMHFSPQDVSFVLIDFKGTGLILPFMNLPHLAGTISDLDKNITRNLVALNSELARRKRLFDAAGVSKISDYLKLYKSGRVSEPMPYLFVVIDEYAEFKAQFPEFTNQINSLFRTGRSIGVHIILLTQNPSGVVSGESESNVRFRWCLKVASTAASKEVLGGHEEAAFVRNPGRAYVRVGSDEVFEPVQSYYSGAPYDPERGLKKDSAVIYQVERNGMRTAFREKVSAGRSDCTEIASVVNHIRDYVESHGMSDSRPIWKDKMPDEIYLPELLRRSEPHSFGELKPVIGLIDDPWNQEQRPLYLPLGADGHVAVIGAPGSGKTVLLQTLAASLCMGYTPEEVNLYVMDFGGWSMGMFRDFPHVCCVANDNEEEKINKIAETLSAEMADRKLKFSAAGVGNLSTYLQVTGEKLPYLVLLVDNFAPVYQLYPKLDEFFIRLGREGGNYGICLVATAGNTMALGYKLNQSIRTMVALQMTDSSDYSSVVGRTEGLIPDRFPGRGLYRENRVVEFQTALPAHIDRSGSYVTAVRALGEQLTALYGKRKAAVVKTMPEEVSFGSVEIVNGGFVLGLENKTIAPLEIDLDTDHHLLISGMKSSGKTTLIKTLLRQIAEKTDSQVVLFCDEGSAGEYDRSQMSRWQGELLRPRENSWQGEEHPAEKRDNQTGADNGRIMCVRTGEEIDEVLTAVSELLTERQRQKKENPAVTFAPVYLLADGYKQFFEVISQQSVNRLKALIMKGAGLGVSFIAADTAAAMTMMVQYMEPLTLLLAKGPAVLLGGKPMEHTAVNTGLPAEKRSIPLKKGEGLYIRGGGRGEAVEGGADTCLFKVMNCR